MRELADSTDYLLEQPYPDQYPLQRRMLVWGLAAALFVGTLLLSPLAGFALLVLFVVVGALWRHDAPPILALCLAYQWFFTMVGYFYQQITGRYPGTHIPGDLTNAILLSLIECLIVTAGVRAALDLMRRSLSRWKSAISVSHYSVPRLFWYVVVAYSIYWSGTIAPMHIWFDAGQIIYKNLAFAAVLLFWLFL